MRTFVFGIQFEFVLRDKNKFVFPYSFKEYLAATLGQCVNSETKLRAILIFIVVCFTAQIDQRKDIH